MRKPFRIGLTGSIAMGKSTTAAMFADEGVPVWDADAAVHRLYAAGGAAVEPLRALTPETIVAGAVSRDALKEWIAKDPAALSRIERIVHPLVASDRDDFAARSAAPVLLFDVPLLFETGLADRMDLVVVASASAAEQRRRALARPGIDTEQFAKILARQMPDDEKRARADVIIDTTTLEGARAAVHSLMMSLREKHA